MVAYIAGLGTALPAVSTPTEAFINHAKKFACKTPRQERILEELYRRSEVSSRCSVLGSGGYGAEAEKLFAPPDGKNESGPTTDQRMRCYAAEAPVLAVAAAQASLADCGIEPSRITHLVTASCTGFSAPGFDIELIRRMPLPDGTLRTHVGFMGCHGVLNALRVARAFAECDRNSVVLLCAVELCSLHFQYGWKSDRLVANSLFSDGAASLVVSSNGDITGGATRGWRLVDSASCVVGGTADAMVWRVGDHGFTMELSPNIPEIISQYLPQWLDRWLASNGCNRCDINGWAVHPGGPRVLDAVQESLGLSDHDLSYSRAILSERGNMSSPTVLFILERMRSAALSGPCIVLGFGPGMTIEAALLHKPLPGPVY